MTNHEKLEVEVATAKIKAIKVKLKAMKLANSGGCPYYKELEFSKCVKDLDSLIKRVDYLLDEGYED